MTGKLMEAKLENVKAALVDLSESERTLVFRAVENDEPDDLEVLVEEARTSLNEIKSALQNIEFDSDLRVLGGKLIQIPERLNQELFARIDVYPRALAESKIKPRIQQLVDEHGLVFDNIRFGNLSFSLDRNSQTVDIYEVPEDDLPF